MKKHFIFGTFIWLLAQSTAWFYAGKHMAMLISVWTGVPVLLYWIVVAVSRSEGDK